MTLTTKCARIKMKLATFDISMTLLKLCTRTTTNGSKSSSSKNNNNDNSTLHALIHKYGIQRHKQFERQAETPSSKRHKSYTHTAARKHTYTPTFIYKLFTQIRALLRKHSKTKHTHTPSHSTINFI